MIQPPDSSVSLRAPGRGATSDEVVRDVVIVGAGFAGAALGFHLAKRGTTRLTLLEKESLPGLHSSGRNAAMVRQVTADPQLARLARRGAAAIRELACELRERGVGELFHRTGSLLVASGEHAEALRRDMDDARNAGLEVECWSRQEALQRFPVLGDARFEIACWCPSDGVVDISLLLDHYLRGVKRAGGEVRFGVQVVDLRQEVDATWTVVTSAGRLRTRWIVDAAGGWASSVARQADASATALRPTRRHLFVTPPRADVSRELPFVWDTTREVYFRPEAGGLLVSACDIGEPGESLEDSGVRPEVFELLKEKLDAQFPSLGDICIKRGWSGIRTLTPDGRFVIGPDPLRRGFFWVAGLGGHGVTTSYSVGELASELLLDPARDATNPFSPARFLSELAPSSP